jgi:predicted glycogen debranching enzyme
LNMEPYRGSPVMEDHLNIGEFRVTLSPGETVTFVISTETSPNLDGQSALAERQANDERLISLAPQMPPRLLLAADQFIVKRAGQGEPDDWSIIAGYHWLRNWGRDTLISLPGLLLATGRYDEARSILMKYSKHVSQGMLPITLPDGDNDPGYKAVDVTLWYFEAIRAYVRETADIDLLRELFPILKEIIDLHESGTRYHIAVDQQDGLLYAGQPGLALTWMDAKADDWCITPRTGKPVEINALWYNALLSMSEFARLLGQSSDHFDKLAGRALAGFSRFWNKKSRYCYDVLDTPSGDDLSLRPNQLLAVSLFYSPLSKEQQKAIVDISIRRLLTPLGLRSLSPDEPGYIGHYGGDAHAREMAYHQGSVWGWLIGPFVSAHLRVYSDAQAARSYLEPFFDHLSERGIGSVSEIFDGDAPFTPRGCIAQAWSVAELLRAWREIDVFSTEVAANTQA